MKNFSVKYIDGKNEVIEGTVQTVDNSIKRITLSEELNYDNIEYIELYMHSETINAGDNGYYIVSAGNGSCQNRDYGLGTFKRLPDSETVLKDCFMPVFGINHGGTCRVAIVTGMCGNVSQVVEIKDNRYSIKLRFLIDSVAPYENIEVEFHELSSDATYSDMAKDYRAYQLEHGFRPLKERLTTELKYSLEAINVRIRMCWKPVPCKIALQTEENEPDVHVACTFDDVIKIMESYKQAGIEKVEFCLVGWNIKGHDGRWPQILPVEDALGGEEGLKKVISRAKELDYAMTCHTNSTDAYSIAENFDKNDIATLHDGNIHINPVLRWAGGRTYKLCPKRGYEISMNTLVPVAKLGFGGMHYIDVITAIPQYECYDKNHPVNKREFGKWFDKLFEETGRLFGSVGCEGPYDHSLKNCDYALYVSFADYRDKNAKFFLCDKNIPFWQIVYHGIVASTPYSKTVNAVASDNKDDLLKVIEFGGKPQIYYYAQFVDDGKDWIGKGDFRCDSREYIDFSTECVKKSEDIYKELSYLQYEYIEDHREVSPGVYKITYSDSSVITVDYNKKTYTLLKGN